MALSASEGHLGRDGSPYDMDGVPVPGCGGLRAGPPTGCDMGDAPLLFSLRHGRSFFERRIARARRRSASRVRARRGQNTQNERNVHCIEKKYVYVLRMKTHV